jgi:hypothetical protein
LGIPSFLVVLFPPPGVVQDLISFLDFPELGGCHLVFRVLVRVVPHGQFPETFADVLHAGLGCQFQDFIVVLDHE